MTASVSAVEPSVPAVAGRVLIVHEWLYTWAGSERCLEEVARLIPTADIVIGTITPDARRRFPVAARARETWLGTIPGARRFHRWFLPMQAIAFSSIDTSSYDLVISLSHSMGKLVRPRGDARHLCYCFSPPRYLWDLQQTYARQSPPLQGAALRLGSSAMRMIDRYGASGVHRFVSISRCVADRVQRAYGQTSAVVYPPVVPKSETTRDVPRGDFLLSFGRLVSYKRVDLAIAAAQQLGMRLVIAGDGPEAPRLRAMARRDPRIEFLGEVSDDVAADLMSTCAAFVFCAEEDFGIAPLEANAHGAPVVAYAKGGALETMVAGETAVFFDEPEVARVVAAVRECVRRDWSPALLRDNARRFSPDRFRKEMLAQIAAVTGLRAQPAA